MSGWKVKLPRRAPRCWCGVRAVVLSAVLPASGRPSLVYGCPAHADRTRSIGFGSADL